MAIVKIMKANGNDLSDVDIHDERIVNEDSEIVEGVRYTTVNDDSGDLLFNQKALQQYILLCSQEFDKGGLRGIVVTMLIWSNIMV
jgi:hypothetical protein